MKPRIKVTSISFSRNPVLRSELLQAFPKAQFNETGKRMDEPDVIEFLKDCDAAIVGLEPVTRSVIDSLPEIQIYAKYGVGLDNLDLDCLKEKGVALGWTGGVNRRSVSELALLFMLALSRNVHQTSAAIREGRWQKDGGRLLSGRTIGIVGCGFVGTDLLSLLVPFDCRCLICDIEDKSAIAAKFQAKQVSYVELLSRADIVSFHVPLTKATRLMFSSEEILLLKKDAVVINTSRGPIFDQAALKGALQAGLGLGPGKGIGGAGLDVFAEEPPMDLELLALPNLMGTPHVGGNAAEAVLAMGRSAIQALKTHFG